MVFVKVPITEAVPQLTECQVVEMPNGQLKLFMRNLSGYLNIATCFDGRCV